MLASGSRLLRWAGLCCASALVGCGSGHSSGNGYASFSWNIYDIGTGALLNCAEAGGATVVVTLFDAGGNVVVQNQESCASGQLSTSNVPIGSYTVGVDLYGDPNVYGGASPLLDSFDLADASGTRVALPIGRGLNDFRSRVAQIAVRSFAVGWTFTSGTAATMCAALGAAYVDLEFSVVGGTTPVASRFICADGAGVSLPYPYPSATTQTTTQWRLYLTTSANTDITFIDGGTVQLLLDSNTSLGTQVFPY